MDVDLLTGSTARRPRTGVWSAVLVLSTTGVVVALTLLFLGMRAVMEVGGACGSGGPYVVATPCPDGVGPLVGLSVPVGVVLVLVHVLAAAKVGAPMVGVLAWPALFLSLGWNFWEYGLSPPGGGGLAWGWLICGVVFVLMGALPLIAVVSAMRTAWSGRDGADPATRARLGWYAVYAVASVAGIVLGTVMFDAVTT